MGKLVNTIIIMGGLSLLFYYAGLTNQTSLLGLFLNPGSLSTSQIYIAALSVSASVLAAIGATILTRSALPDFYLMWPVVAVLFLFGWDMIVVFQKLQGTGPVGTFVAVIVFSPILISYLIGVIEWWRGVET